MSHSNLLDRFSTLDLNDLKIYIEKTEKNQIQMDIDSTIALKNAKDDADLKKYQALCKRLDAYSEPIEKDAHKYRASKKVYYYDWVTFGIPELVNGFSGLSEEEFALMEQFSGKTYTVKMYSYDVEKPGEYYSSDYVTHCHLDAVYKAYLYIIENVHHYSEAHYDKLLKSISKTDTKCRGESESDTGSDDSDFESNLGLYELRGESLHCLHVLEDEYLCTMYGVEISCE